MNTRALIEAILFVYGEPLLLKELAKLIHKDEAEVRSYILDLQVSLENEDRGLSLIIHDNKAQLVTKKESASIIQKLLKSEFQEELSPAAEETLAIIAYFGPVSRGRIDYLRGVNSSYILRNLLLRGLIVRSAEVKKAGVYFYSLSFDFLKHLGIRKTDELPECGMYRKVIKDLENKT